VSREACILNTKDYLVDAAGCKCRGHCQCMGQGFGVGCVLSQLLDVGIRFLDTSQLAGQTGQRFLYVGYGLGAIRCGCVFSITSADKPGCSI
jgi:hypothetical protein